MQNQSIARLNSIVTVRMIPIEERDPVELAAQEVSQGLTDLLLAAHATQDLNRLEQIRKVLHALSVEVASVQESVGQWTDQCASLELPWGV